MDAVRFGRALGFGARQAVKTVATAVDAATAANPSEQSVNANRNGPEMAQERGAGESPGATATPSAKAAASVAQTVAQSREVGKGLQRGTKRFSEAVWSPVIRLSGVLWLEVAGVFFGIFAVFALGHIWELRGQWHSTETHAAGLRSLAGSLAMLVIFGYFCVSSFVRARRRERRR